MITLSDQNHKNSLPYTQIKYITPPKRSFIHINLISHTSLQQSTRTNRNTFYNIISTVIRLRVWDKNGGDRSCKMCFWWPPLGHDKNTLSPRLFSGSDVFRIIFAPISHTRARLFRPGVEFVCSPRVGQFAYIGYCSALKLLLSHLWVCVFLLWGGLGRFRDNGFWNFTGFTGLMRRKWAVKWLVCVRFFFCFATKLYL